MGAGVGGRQDPAGVPRGLATPTLALLSRAPARRPVAAAHQAKNGLTMH